MNIRNLALAALLIGAVACSKEEAKENLQNTSEKVAAKVEDIKDDIAVPLGTKDDPAAREKERFDEQWRQLESFRAQQAAQQRAQQQAAAQQAANAPKLNFVTGVKESLKDLNPQAIDAAPINVPIQGDVSGPSVLKAQVYLDRIRFSVGALDGRWGRNSAIAVWWFQRSRGMEANGVLDEATFRALATEAGAPQAVVSHTLTADDVKGPFVSVPDDMYDKAKLECLCYESRAEKLAERFHTTIDLLEKLNPEVKLGDVAEGQSIVVPNVRPPVTADNPDIARVVVSIAGNTFNAYDAAGNLIFHAPTTLGSKYDPSPRETVQVKKIAHDPHFHYQPELFHEVPDTEPEANLNPGPNSPVGVVWIALTKPHFGIHGTSDPDSIGYASSHGCVRLTNWDAKEVAHRIQPGVNIEFVDTRKKT